MEISVSTGLYYTKPYKEILDVIAASGCKNIELFLNQAFIDIPLEELEFELVKRNLNVSSIHLPLTFIAYDRNEDEKYWIEKGLEYLEKLEGEVLVSHFFYDKHDKNLSNDISHFGNIEEYASKTRKYICTENLPKLWVNTKHQKPYELVQFLSENKCHMTYDITHVASHDRDIIEDYKLYQDHIRNIHLSDYIDGNEHKVLGTGSLPIKAFINLLKQDNYKYPLTLEFDFENPSRNSFNNNEEASRAIADSIQYILDIVR